MALRSMTTLHSSIETPSFIWKQHYLFCGEDCDVHRDKKHPDGWRPAYESHTSDRGAAGTFKEVIIKMCDERDDQWSDEVRTRLSDRRSYHDDCRKNFMRIKKQKLDLDEDKPLKCVLNEVGKTLDRIWTSIDLETSYKEKGGKLLSRKKLLDCVQNNFGDIMITLSSPGSAVMVIFRKYASTVIRIQEDENEIAKMQEKKVADVAKTIAEEIKSIEHDKTTYKKGINIGIVMEDASPTLSQLLSYISPRLKECSLPSIMIGNIVTSQSQRRNTHLLLALSLLVRERRKSLNVFMITG